MIQLTRAGLIADPADVERLRLEFQHAQFVRLPQFLQPDFFAFVERSIARSQWEPHSAGFDSEEVLQPGSAVDLLHFVANWPQVLDLVHRITGCGPFTWFGGRLYRMRAGAGHYDDWHTDDVDGRLALRRTRRHSHAG